MAEQNPKGGTFRPLFPRFGDILSLPQSQQQLNSISVSKRTIVLAACEACRQRKIKCDGGRPKCASCNINQRICAYHTNPAESRASALKRKHKELEDNHKSLQESRDILHQLFHTIQSRPEADAAVIFRRIREGADLETIAQLIRDGDILLQLQVSPEKKSHYNSIHRQEMTSVFGSTEHPYGDFIPNDTSHLLKSEQLVFHLPIEYQYSLPHARPHGGVELVDPRIDMVNPSEWTSISSNDTLMRSLLRSFFLYEYDWFTCFHKDHFLDDMCSGSKQYCSSLLVNAILALTCYCSHEDLEPNQTSSTRELGNKFLEKAKEMMDSEQITSSSLTTIQSALIINMILNISCVGNLGFDYGMRAVAMCHELKLFEQTPQHQGKRKQISFAFTAWCVYFWISVQCYWSLIAPVFKDPPATPLPNPDDNPAWYGETWIQRPPNLAPWVMNHGRFFELKCNLAAIINQVATRLFEKNTKADSEHNSRSLSDLAVKLSSWNSSLSMNLTPDRVTFRSQVKLHLMYHGVMVNLYGSILANEESFCSLDGL